MYIHNNKIASLADRGLGACQHACLAHGHGCHAGVYAFARGGRCNVVDGYLLPWEVVPTMKLQEITKYHSEISPPQPGLYTAVFTTMNQRNTTAWPELSMLG